MQGIIQELYQAPAACFPAAGLAGGGVLNLYKLEVFHTVALEGSFSRAARRLLLSQPAVSQHIRDLESSLGTQLFQRGSQGVSLTPAGAVLLDYTHRILDLLAEAENAVSGSSQGPSGQLWLGATPGAGVYLLPGWMQTFRQQFAHISAHLRTDTTPVLAAEVAAGKIDLGFVEGEIEPEPRLNVLPLREIELRVAVGQGHPWWDAPGVSILDLDRQAFIARPAGSHTRAWTDQLFAQHGISPNRVAEFDHPEAIKQAVVAGMGISLLPDWAFTTSETAVRGIPIHGGQLRCSLKLLWAAHVPFKPPARAFLGYLSAQFPALDQMGQIP